MASNRLFFPKNTLTHKSYFHTGLIAKNISKISVRYYLTATESQILSALYIRFSRYASIKCNLIKIILKV